MSKLNQNNFEERITKIMLISRIERVGGGTLSSRDDYWDSLKGWLIILVVFGHMAHLGFNTLNVILINWIYSFHMPVFVFVSGYFSNPDSKNYKKGLLRLIETYVVFQILYTILFKEVNSSMFLYPVFGLWYILSLVFWRISAFMMSKLSWKNNPFVWFLGSVIVSVVICCVPINGELSFQKTIAFFPYFVIGMIAKNYRIRSLDCIKRSFPSCVLLYVITIVFFGCLREYFADVFSMSRSIYDINTPLCLRDFIGQDLCVCAFLKWSLIRALCLLLGLTACWTHLNLPENKYLVKIGRNSLTIYIFHIFVYLSAQKVGHFLHFPTYLPFVILYTMAVVIVLNYMSSFRFVKIMLNPCSYVINKMKGNG